MGHGWLWAVLVAALAIGAAFLPRWWRRGGEPGGYLSGPEREAVEHPRRVAKPLPEPEFERFEPLTMPLPKAPRVQDLPDPGRGRDRRLRAVGGVFEPDPPSTLGEPGCWSAGVTGSGANYASAAPSPPPEAPACPPPPASPSPPPAVSDPSPSPSPPSGGDCG